MNHVNGLRKKHFKSLIDFNLLFNVFAGIRPASVPGDFESKQAASYTVSVTFWLGGEFFFLLLFCWKTTVKPI